jgi:predicted DNA-binding transcriptional regulator AlpA
VRRRLEVSPQALWSRSRILITGALISASLSRRNRQAEKIRELGEALIATGHLHLDQQATVLGLARSTTWHLIHARHKTSGLSGPLIKQMLAQARLPEQVRIKIIEYVDGKRAGQYGHIPPQVRRFIAALKRQRHGLD